VLIAQQALDVLDVAADDRSVKVRAGDVGVAAQHAKRRVMRHRLARAADAPVGARLLEESRHDLVAVALCERAVGEGSLQGGPALESVLTGERMLHVAKARRCGGSGVGAAQSSACRLVVVSNGGEPALRFLAKTLEAALGRERAHDLPP